MKTARLKVELAKDNPIMYWPYEDFWGEIIGCDSPGVDSQYQPRLEDELNPEFTYWKRDHSHLFLWNTTPLRAYAACVSQHDALMQLPRIYLGAAEWQTFMYNSKPSEGESADEHKRKEIEHVKTFSGHAGEVRDSITGFASIAHRHPQTNEWMPGINGTYDGVHASASGYDDVWLVIYPSPDSKSLIPILYQPCAEWGTLLIPLTERSLITLKELTYVGEGEPRSMYLRIKELMGFGGDQFEIFNQWQNTAPDVLHNPILQAHNEFAKKQHVFNQTIKAFWSESSAD